mmetsp:Transcript_29439/g.75953  ORF Transcript_29439/g.75953 Transcript_29439/m.75953 type:complete len:333 (+) Transcript_29439:190-1188(+)
MEGEVFSCSIYDGRWLAAAGSIGGIFVYDVLNRVEIEQGKMGDGEVDTKSVQQRVIAFDRKVYNLETVEGILFIAHDGGICAMKWEEIVGSDGVPSIADVRGNHAKSGGGAFEVEVNAVSGVEGSSVVAFGGGDNSVLLFDIASWQQTGEMRGHAGFISSLDSTPSVVASASEDGTGRVWDIRSKDELQTFEPKSLLGTLPPSIANGSKYDWLGAISISEDGQWLAMGGGAGIVTTWQPSYKAVASAFAVNGAVHSLSFSLDGRVVAATSVGGIYQTSLSGEVLYKRQSGLLPAWSIGEAMLANGSKVSVCMYKACRMRTCPPVTFSPALCG